MSDNLFSLNQSKTEFLFIGIRNCFLKSPIPLHSCLPMSSSPPSDSARNLCFICDTALALFYSISSVSKSVSSSQFVTNVESEILSPLYTTAHISHSLQGRLLQLSLSEPCSLSTCSLARSRLVRLQFTLNCAARAVFKTPPFTNISPNLKSLHRLKNRSAHALQNSLNHLKTFQFSKPSYLHNFCMSNLDTCTRSSAKYDNDILFPHTNEMRVTKYLHMRRWDKNNEDEWGDLECLLKANQARVKLDGGLFSDTRTVIPERPRSPHYAQNNLHFTCYTANQFNTVSENVRARPLSTMIISFHPYTAY